MFILDTKSSSVQAYQSPSVIFRSKSSRTNSISTSWPSRTR